MPERRRNHEQAYRYRSAVPWRPARAHRRQPGRDDADLAGTNQRIQRPAVPGAGLHRLDGRTTHPATAAVKAVRDLGKDNGFTVQSNGDPLQFVEENLKRFRTVIFLNTSGDVLTADPAGRLRGVLHDRRRFLGDPRGDRDGARLGRSSPTSSARGRPVGPPSSRDDQGRRSRPRGVEEPSRVLDPDRRLVQLRRQRPRASATCWRPSSTGRPRCVRIQPWGVVDRHHGRHDGLDHPIAWCKDYQGGRSFYTGARQHAGQLRGPDRRRTSPGRSGGRPACRSGVQRLRRDGARELPADQGLCAAEPSASRSASTSCPTAA